MVGLGGRVCVFDFTCVCFLFLRLEFVALAAWLDGWGFQVVGPHLHVDAVVVHVYSYQVRNYYLSTV